MLETLFGFAINASPEDWFVYLTLATAIYGPLLFYLVLTHHMELSPSADHGAGCVGHREKTKYRIAGGVGTYTFGIIPWLAYVYLFPSWDWLIYLAGAQFVMSVVDVLALWAQFIFNFGPEFVLLRSHGLRHPGCGRTSAWDPIGGAMYLAQIIFKVNLGIPRGLWQFFVYDLPGWPIALIVNLPALLTGKFVFPLPF